MASISFIIPAYNEERLLGCTLSAINQAARALEQPVEVLVVDDASTDGTSAIAEAHGARVVSVKCRQIAATRNAGATSGRKLRAYSGREVLAVLLRLAFAGKTVSPRDGLDIWYGERRADPDSDA